MNITKETEDYFNSIKERPYAGIGIKNYIDTYGIDKFREVCQEELNLQDKLKTTPSAGLTFIGKTFKINWSKIFKRGWLLWK